MTRGKLFVFGFANAAVAGLLLGIGRPLGLLNFAVATWCFWMRSRISQKEIKRH